MENKNLSSVKYFFDSGDEENYSGSTPYVSSDSDTDSDANDFIVKPSVTPAAAASSFPVQPKCSNSDEEESDLDVKLSDIAAEARGGLKKGNGGPEKPRSMPGASDPDTAGKKRAAAGLVAEAKRPKGNSETEGSGRKRGDLFRRIFSEDDEIALLKGMIGYESAKQADPFADVSAFKEFVKPDLQSDPKVDQLLLKMRKLKTKYEKNKLKEESGKARNLKAHERRAYDLSKLVNWNDGRKGAKSAKTPKPPTKRVVAKKTQVEKANADGNNEAVNADIPKLVENPTKSVVAKKTQVEKANADGNNEAVNADVPKLAEIVSWNHSNLDRIGARLFEGENRAEGEAEWHKLQMKEIDLQRQILELMSAKSKLVSRALKTENYSK